MNPWIAAVIVASGLTIVVLIVAVLSSIATVKDLARSAQRFKREVGALAAEIGRDAGDAGQRASRLQAPGRDRAT